MPIIKQIQLGKNGLSENFMGNLKHLFDNCYNIRISVLRSCCRDKEELKKISEEILEKLGKNYTARLIGYTIVLKRWTRDVR